MSATSCPSCGAPRSVTKVYHPTTGKVIRRITNPCRRCS